MICLNQPDASISLCLKEAEPQFSLRSPLAETRSTVMTAFGALEHCNERVRRTLLPSWLAVLPCQTLPARCLCHTVHRPATHQNKLET